MTRQTRGIYFCDEDVILEPGALYMIETTGGPWKQFPGNIERYDMQIKVGDAEWAELSEWAGALCVVEADPLGHVRVWFEVPADETMFGKEYRLRVNIPQVHVLASGEMGWNLWSGIDLGIDPGTGGACGDYQFNPDITTGIGEVNARLEDGAVIPGLANNQFFAIQIHSADEAGDPPTFEKSGWYESDGGAERDDLEMTIDGGNTWQDLPNHPGVLCYYYTPVEDELVIFIRVLNGQSWKFRANSETFDDNSGKEYFSVHPASVGENPWLACENYTASVPALNEYEIIRPQDEEGENIIPTLTYTPGNDPDGDGIIIWGDAGLASGHIYRVETLEGPWYDGTNPDRRYTAQLSSDGGATWYSFEEHPDVLCYQIDQLGWYEKAFFEVTTGQVWKIRVADSETDVFTDNTGNLAYRLNLVNEFPVDGPGDLVIDYNPGAADVCISKMVSPGVLSLSEIGSLGNYIGDWLRYFNRSILSYFAWCPRHTEMLLSAINALKEKEPLATIREMSQISKDIVDEVESYDWEGGGMDDKSIFSGNVDVEDILPTGGGGGIWEGGDLVVFGDTQLPGYYYSCNSTIADYLPSGLRTGVCFTTAYWKETGASFWVQLSLDISALFALFLAVKGAVQSLVYMMTGVRPWTKDGFLKGLGNYAGGDVWQGEVFRAMEDIQKRYIELENKRLDRWLRK